MRRHNIFIFLVILSVSALFNVSMTWWPDAWRYSAAVKEMSSTAVAQAEELATTSSQANQGNMPEPVREGSAIIAIATAEASVFSGSVAGNVSQEEAEVLLNLRSIKKDMDLRSKALDERQRSIEEAEAGVATRINELESLVAKLQDQLQQEKSIKSKKIKKLAAVYSSMKAEKAAPVITMMKLDTVVKMFARMDDKKVGKILSFLAPEKAVSITQALTRKVAP